MAANSGRSLLSLARSARRRMQFVGGFGEAVGNFGFGDLRLAEPLQHFAQGRLGDAFRLGGFGQAVAELPVQQEMPDVRRDLDREPRPILEFGDGVRSR